MRSRATNDDDCGYTSRKHNTHNTETREVLYRWHPWFGRMAWIFNVVEKNGEIILRCALDPHEATARVSEMPQWMFDPVVCRHIRHSVLQFVDCEALRELKRLRLGAAIRRMRPKAYCHSSGRLPNLFVQDVAGTSCAWSAVMEGEGASRSF